MTVGGFLISPFRFIDTALVLMDGVIYILTFALEGLVGSGSDFKIAKVTLRWASAPFIFVLITVHVDVQMT